MTFEILIGIVIVLILAIIGIGYGITMRMLRKIENGETDKKI